MKTVIWKYQLKITDQQTIEIPCEHKILSVAQQNGILCMWVEVNPDAYLSEVDIVICGTGNPIPHIEGYNLIFVGTVVMNPFVWHVFKREVE